MKKLVVAFGMTVGILFLLDLVISYTFTSVYSSPQNWDDNVKAARQLANGLLLYGGYVAFLRIANAGAPLAFNPKQAIQHGLFGLGGAFLILFICLILTPEFYGPKSSFRMLPWQQILMPLVVFISGAIMEEVFFRGILQRFFSWILPWYIATPLQVSLFVYVHFPSILGHSSPITRAVDIGMAGLLFTLLAKKSPYLILPIFFHAGGNFFTDLIRGQYGNGWAIPGIWSYQDYLRVAYRPYLYIIACSAILYWMQHPNQSKINKA